MRGRSLALLALAVSWGLAPGAQADVLVRSGCPDGPPALVVPWSAASVETCIPTVAEACTPDATCVAVPPEGSEPGPPPNVPPLPGLPTGTPPFPADPGALVPGDALPDEVRVPPEGTELPEAPGELPPLPVDPGDVFEQLPEPPSGAPEPFSCMLNETLAGAPDRAPACAGLAPPPVPALPEPLGCIVNNTVVVQDPDGLAACAPAPPSGPPQGVCDALRGLALPAIPPVGNPDVDPALQGLRDTLASLGPLPGDDLANQLGCPPPT